MRQTILQVTAAYIRSQYPGKWIAVSGWGMRFHDPESMPHLTELSKHIDYLIDVRDSSRQKDPAQRKRVVQTLHCAFGTPGGPQVELPQSAPSESACNLSTLMVGGCASGFAHPGESR